MPSSTSAARSAAPDATQLARAQARQFLAVTYGFDKCPAETLEALVAGGTLRSFDADEVLLRQGEAFDMLCVVLQGAFNFCQLRPDGQRNMLSVQCPGDTVGYVPLVDGSLYPYDILARADGSQMLLIPGAHVRSLRQQHPGIGQAIEMQLAVRVRLAFAKLSREARQPIDVRLAGTLLIWARRYGVPRDGATVIEHKISQEDFADILGASRQRVNFAIRELKKAGLADFRYARIVIPDLARLADYAGEPDTSSATPTAAPAPAPEHATAAAQS